MGSGWGGFVCWLDGLLVGLLVGLLDGLVGWLTNPFNQPTQPTFLTLDKRPFFLYHHVTVHMTGNIPAHTKNRAREEQTTDPPPPLCAFAPLR
jgi:hypothetical protein